MTSWQPSWKWHFITLSILLVTCIVGYWMASWVSNRLPAPYQPRTVAQDTTPWKK